LGDVRNEMMEHRSTIVALLVAGLLVAGPLRAEQAAA